MPNPKFEKGEKVFFIQSAIFVKEVEVIKDVGGFVTAKIFETGGGIRLREDRFFKTREEAETSIRKR